MTKKVPFWISQQHCKLLTEGSLFNNDYALKPICSLPYFLKENLYIFLFFLSDVNSSVSTMEPLEVYKKLDLRTHYLDRDEAFNCRGFYSNIII